ncbi:phosphoserine phosphatase SerB [Rhodobacteraceae bacterium F11138]|nr:phosphoserine phosphatase SerB [Rhodobacteraceae bacterium F11138]
MDRKLIVLGYPTKERVAQFAERLKRGAGVDVSDVHVSATGPSTIYVDLPDSNQMRARLHALAHEERLDVLIGPRTIERITLFIADMEATIIQDEMLDRLGEERGVSLAGTTARAMAGEIDFEQSLIERTRLLAGTTEALLKSLCSTISYTPGAKALVTALKAQGVTTVLVTGGYDTFAKEVARTCGFDAIVSNTPILKNGVMTGEIERPICTAKTKRDVLLDYCKKLGIDPYSACCIGDGANDLLMLQTCGLPVSFKGKPIVQEVVNLNITSGDLTSVLAAVDLCTPKALAR